MDSLVRRCSDRQGEFPLSPRPQARTPRPCPMLGTRLSLVDAQSVRNASARRAMSSVKTRFRPHGTVVTLLRARHYHHLRSMVFSVIDPSHSSTLTYLRPAACLVEAQLQSASVRHLTRSVRRSPALSYSCCAALPRLRRESEAERCSIHRPRGGAHFPLPLRCAWLDCGFGGFLEWKTCRMVLLRVRRRSGGWGIGVVLRRCCGVVWCGCVNKTTCCCGAVVSHSLFFFLHFVYFSCPWKLLDR